MPTHNAEIRMLWGTPCAMGLPRATELRTRTTDCYDAGRRIGRVLLRGVFRGPGILCRDARAFVGWSISDRRRKSGEVFTPG